MNRQLARNRLAVNGLERIFSRTLILLAVISTALTACAPQIVPAVSVPTDNCGPIEPSDKDVQYALSFGKDLFSNAQWIKSYTVEPYKISISRHNDTKSSVAYLEYLIYNCGYGQKDLGDYFNDQGFDIVFGSYDSHSLAHFCEIKSLALYEYDLVSDGQNYSARYWVEQNSDTRVLVMMLVYPVDDLATLDQYSQQLFPQLAACPK